jgi:hypothetical protein
VRAEAEVARLRAELEAQGARAVPAATVPPAPAAAPAPDPVRAEPASLYDLPLSTLVARYAPWRPRLWRGVRRRIARVRR